MQIIEEDRKGNFLNLLQETVDLDQLFRIKYKSLKGGQHLPELPENIKLRRKKLLNYWVKTQQKLHHCRLFEMCAKAYNFQNEQVLF